MTIRLQSTILLLVALAGTGLVCTHHGPVAGIEVTNGDCSGTIYNQDSTVAAGAVVRLIPVEYDPRGTSAGTVDSTTTDKAGRYTFDVAKADFYNIIAEKDGTSCISEEIPLQPAVSVVVNDTLRASGKLAGRVSVKPEDDVRNVVILVRGTNLYTTPTDSGGAFATPPLPAGTFTVQILYTGGAGYAGVDTLVTILPGKTTDLLVTLPSADAPPVTGFSVAYDSATMFVSLRWTMPDTSKIVSYSLYRKSENGNDTTVIVDKSATAYIDDVIRHQDDTLLYRIAAIGKNYREGYWTATKPVVAGGKVPCVNELDLTAVASFNEYLASVNSIYSDGGDDVYLVFGKSIKKLSLSGNVRKTFQLTDTSDRVYFSGNLQPDDSGNLYVMKQSCSPSIIKLDTDLNVRAEYPFEPPVDSDRTGAGQFMITGNGSMYLVTVCSGEPSFNFHSIIRLFAPGFSEISAQAVIGREVFSPVRFGDTIVTLEYHQRPVGNLIYSDPYVTYYDASFNQLSAFQPDTFGDSYWIPSVRNCNPYYFGGPGGIIVSMRNSNFGGSHVDVLLIFSNTKGEFLARILLSAYPFICFDNAGNFYCYSHTEYDDMYQYKTLFKYSMTPLLSTNGR